MTCGYLKFLAPTSPPPVFGPSVGGAGARSTLAGDYESHEIEILDARELGETFSLDTHGFELGSLPEVGDLYDKEVTFSLHDPQCCDLVSSVTGASRVHIFDHTWRSDSADTRGQHASREPSSFVHNDYTPRSALNRVRDLMGDEADALLRKDFAIVNVWRPIAPVRSSPVAVCDARTLADGALVPAERRGNSRIGEIFLVRFDSRQRWIFFPRLATYEILLIKTFDSRTDGRARWCAHTSFETFNDSPGAPPRESVETRLFAFFDS